MPTEEVTSHDSSNRGRAGRRFSPSTRNALSASLILVVMLAAVLGLTLHRSSPNHASAAPVTPPPSPSSGGATAVSIRDFAFDPPMVRVKVGDTITWTNVDTEAHTVRTTKSTTVKSDVLDTNGTFAFTFTTPGTYDYHCSIHPEMHGVVVVSA